MTANKILAISVRANEFAATHGKTDLRRLSAISIVSALALLLLSFRLAAAQAPTATVTINSVDTTNFPEVRVYVSVLEADGSPRLNLPKESFSLSEGGATVNVDTVSSQLDQIFVVMMLDATGSMDDLDSSGNKPINILKNAAASFVQKMSPQDVFAVYTFHERSALRCNFTSDRKVLTDCLSRISAEPKDTALWDSAMEAVKKAAEIPRGRRAVVLFSDGDDNLSKNYSVDDIIRQATEFNIPVYTIAAYSRELSAQPAKLNAARNALGRLASNTRGQSLTSNLISDLPKLFDRLSAQLKSQYVIVYTSSAAEGKTALTIRVKDVPSSDALVFLVPSLQATIPPAISRIDTAQFPEIKAFVSAPSLPAGVPVTPTLANFVVQEDRTRVPTTALSADKRGALLQILVDTSADLNGPGATQEKIWLEQRKAILELVADNTTWLDRQDRKDVVSAKTPTNDPNHPGFPFATDYNLLKNFAYSDQTPARSQVPFDQLLRQGIDTIRQYSQSEGRRRMLLVLTNGIQANVEQSKLQDVADLAKENNVAVFVVYFGNSEAARPAIYLRRIASLANWRYYWYTSVDSIKPAYQQIGNLGKQYVVAFRSKASTSGNHVVRVTLTAGEQPSPRPESFVESQYSIDLQPPEIELSLTSPGGVVRTASGWNTAVADSEPQTASINLAINWPDGHSRKISKITYSFDGGPERAVSNPPTEAGPFQVDVRDLDEGRYTLNVIVEDELGQTESAELTVPVRISLPLTALVLRFLTRVFPVTAILVSLIILVLAVYIYRKRPAIVMGAVGAIQTSVKVATDFFVRPGKGERKPAKAYLVPIGGDDTRLGPIPLYGEITRLGRDDTWANIVLQDTTVSRLHAKIVEEADSNYKVFDEGSRSGTYVNDEEVQMNGQWLRDGDTVAFGRDEFQFKMKLGPKEATAIFERMSRQVSAKEDTVGKGEPVRDATEPKMSLSAKEETEGRTPRAAKEQTDAQTPRSAKEETDVKQPPPAKEETDVPIRSAKEETDVKAPRVAPPEPLIRIPIAYLVPIAGTDANMGAIPIHDETTRLGRDDHWATIALRDSAVSRKHARIVKENAGLRICDERSKAGTQVNDTPIPGDGQLLQEGDKITLGNDEFHFKLSPDAAERAAVAHAASDKPQVSTSAKPAKEATEPRMPIRTKEDTDVSVRE